MSRDAYYLALDAAACAGALVRLAKLAGEPGQDDDAIDALLVAVVELGDTTHDRIVAALRLLEPDQTITLPDGPDFLDTIRRDLDERVRLPAGENACRRGCHAKAA